MALAAVLWWQVERWGSGSSSDGEQSAASATSGLTMYPPGERAEAPDLEGRTLDGAEFSLDELVGHVVVINVWGSWCAPCRAETPDLVRVAGETSDRGVRFVGIDTRDNLAAAKAFAAKFRVPYPSVFDPDGQALLAFQSVVPIAAVPSTVVVDADGNVAARVIGRVTYATLSGLIDDVDGGSGGTDDEGGAR
ncbi:TlpA disulfide reductase family protein [Nocardioides caricicola]|uniref:TlpA family protein disulfide reductase n=1 Tax=Nocardioides caricicola TaxID=634770 RepID=A0ABW0N6H9_9ACTN